MTVDALDEALIALLREDARMAVSELARRLEVARTTIAARIERLERQGVIAGYTLRLSEDHERGRIRALVLIKVASRANAAATAALRSLREVTELHSISGEYDLAAVVSAASIQALDAAVDTIGEAEGVERTASSVILATKFQR
ncbi:MAG: Lrp/AsnC family transcriptional regulator [Kiloniellales bacterium]